MAPCFPVNNNTDVHHCDIVSNCSSPSHLTEDSLLILPKSEPGQLSYHMIIINSILAVIYLNKQVSKPIS